LDTLKKAKIEKGVLGKLCYVATFFLVFLSFVYKNELLILYSFEVFYILLIGLYIIKRNIKIGKYALWSAAFFTVCLLSYIYSVDQVAAFRQIFNVLKILLIGNTIVFFIDKNKKKINFILISIILSAIYLTVLLIIQTPLSYWGTNRLGSNIGLNANDLGLKMAISSLIAIYFAKENKKAHLYILAFIFSTITLFSGSRKAFLLILIGLFFLYILTIKRRRRLLFVIPVLSGIVYLFWYIVMNNTDLYNVLGVRIEQLLNALSGEGNVDNSTIVRFQMIDEGINLFKERPFLGYGIDNYASISTFSTYSHNNYIELLVGVGIFGTVIYYSLYVSIFFKLIKFVRVNKIAGLFISIILGLAILEYGLVTYYIEIFVILLAAAYSAADISNKLSYLNHDKKDE
jgi:O-antigen ligase